MRPANRHVCRLPVKEAAARTATQASAVIPAAVVCEAAAHTPSVHGNQCSAHGKSASHSGCDPTSPKQPALPESVLFILQTGKRSQMR